jgi:hypothetical protein
VADILTRVGRELGILGAQAHAVAAE